MAALMPSLRQFSEIVSFCSCILFVVEYLNFENRSRGCGILCDVTYMYGQAKCSVGKHTPTLMLKRRRHHVPRMLPADFTFQTSVTGFRNFNKLRRLCDARGSKSVPQKGGGNLRHVRVQCTPVHDDGSENRMILMGCSGMTASPQPFLGVVVGVVSLAGGPAATRSRNGAVFNLRAGIHQRTRE